MVEEGLVATFAKNKRKAAGEILFAGVGALLLLIQCAHSEINFTTMVHFDGTNGYMPQSPLVEGRDGNFYGTLSYGGWFDLGTLFRMSPDGACIILITFNGENGSHPSSLLQGKDGNFYGTTLEGGPSGGGSIFKMQPDGTISTLAAFTDIGSGVGPGGLVQGEDDCLYGSTSLGGPAMHGSTFKFTTTGELTMPATNSVLTPGNRLLKGKDGNYYGAIFADDRLRFGSVFRKTPDGVVTTVSTFNWTNGASPLPELVPGRDGNMYGITVRGGAFNQGTIFRLSFGNAPTPATPASGVNIPVLLHAVSNNVDPRMLEMMQAPIEFFGKVVDENGNAGSRAGVTFEWNDLTARGFASAATTQSDDSGLFSLHGKHGGDLVVSTGKQGYYSTHSSRQNFRYAKMFADERHQPDARKPVVFSLRKKGAGANALITSQYGVRDGFWVTVPKDGTAISVDLLNRKAGSGPLEITQRKPPFPSHGGTVESFSPSDRAKLMSATNWSFSMTIKDGGFIEENEEFPFQPPESGYRSSVNYEFQKGETNWTMNFKQKYFIKFGSPPLYGQLDLETWADNDNVILTYVVNPDGSRNLEPQ